MRKRGIYGGALLVLLAASCEDESSVGRVWDVTVSPIIGGDLVSRGERPWQVQLGGSGHFCGGSLIARRWVLTAAHCVEDLPSWGVTVTLGERTIDQADGTEQVQHGVRRVHLHPHYSWEQAWNPPKNDVALLHLSEDAVLNNDVQIIPLAAGDDGEGLNAVASGWGKTLANSGTSDRLMQAVLPIRSNATCNQDPNMPADLAANEICAGFPAGEKATCMGDSGGPLAVRRPDGRWELIGLTSWGGGEACQTYSVFARVSSQLSWIRGVMNEYATNLWIQDFGYAQGWRVDRHPRVMADVNGDGKKDIVGFGYHGVTVALSTGNAFGPASLWIGDYGEKHGWVVDRHVRVVSDVNGDGKGDIVGFGNDGVRVSLSTGSAFAPASLWSGRFGYSTGAGGWSVAKHPRVMAEVSGDDKEDVVGFGDAGVYVAVSTGTGFAEAKLWSAEFGYGGGWRTERHLRVLADIDGDKKKDVVGIGEDDEYTAISLGTAFGWLTRGGCEFKVSNGWSIDSYPRMVGDVNSDGRADLVGLFKDAVYVDLTLYSREWPDVRWSQDFVYDDGWRGNLHPRMLADLDGDGTADLVGFFDDGVYAALSTTRTFTTSILRPTVKFEPRFGNLASAGGWTPDKYLRTMADVDGDGREDVVGFGHAGVYVVKSDFVGFED